LNENENEKEKEKRSKEEGGVKREAEIDIHASTVHNAQALKAATRA
jgi:hypothetical protein